MTTMITEVYEAFKDAGTSEEKAKATASAIADYSSRFDSLEAELKIPRAEFESETKILKTELSIVKWMLGFVIAGIVSMLIKLFI